MNCIISSYLTTGLDPQRGTKKDPNDPAYIQDWYDSIEMNTPPRWRSIVSYLLHDGLSEEFKSKFPHLNFIQVPPCGEYQLYDYRWVIYRQFLKTHPEIENVFFTDVSDVKVVQNPFVQKEYSSKNLYCGDETGMMYQNEWLKNSLQNEQLCQLHGFKEMINSDLPLLNCGIFGGGRFAVLEFLSMLIHMIDRVKYRQIDTTVDMPLFNYVACEFNIIHGAPVNSIFKGYESRNDVWFIHK